MELHTLVILLTHSYEFLHVVYFNFVILQGNFPSLLTAVHCREENSSQKETKASMLNAVDILAFV